MSKLRTPQEKKRASLTKDRRNDYGENAKASRKNIPRSKARAERAYRRGVHEALRAAAAPLDEASLNVSEKQIAEARLRLGFRKSPDIPLAEHIRKQKRRRR
ncbi:MAG TPA: hypothetical protein VFN91_10815 [Myxococcaceae bacterium]|nr:hypothetical protein [Myxococcaceae bacterium]